MNRSSVAPPGQIGLSPTAQRATSSSPPGEAEAIRRLELLAEHSSDVLCEVRQGKITYISPNTTRISGSRPDEFVGRPLAQFIHPDDLARYAHFMQPGWTGVIEATFRMAHASGEWQWREARGVRVLDPDGAHRAVFVLRDIGERRQAEEALRLSEDRARALLTAIPDLMFRMTRDGILLDFKAERAEDLYVPPETIIGNNVRDLLPPDLVARILPAVERALDQGGVQALEYSLLKKAGLRDYEARITANGADEVVIIARDVTDRVTAERALVSSEEKYRKLVEGAHDIIYTTDLGGGITSVNRAVERVLGYTPEEVIGLTTLDLVDESQRTALAELYAEWSRTGKTEGSGEWLTRRKDGEPVWIETTATALQLDGRPVGLLMIGRDVTGRKRAAAEARDADERDAIQRERARIAQELHDNVAQFFFGIGIASKDLSEKKSPAASTVRRKLAQIQRLAVDGGREVRQAVRALSSTAPPEGLDASIARLFADLRRGSGLDVSYLREGDEASLSASVQNEMYRAAREALYNVRKHAHASSVSIRLCVRRAEAVLTARDDGIGRATDIEGAMQGVAGFGLRNLRERFERHGGRLEIRDNDGRGVSLTFCLPIEVTP